VNRKLFFGIDTSVGTNGAGYIQANRTGAGSMDLYLQPIGGQVVVGAGGLVVDGNIQGGGVLRLGYGGSTMSIGPDAGSKDLTLYTDGGLSSPRLTILSASGNVGIGTASPGAALEVNGNMKLSSVNSSIMSGDVNHQISLETTQYLRVGVISRFKETMAASRR